MPLFCSIDKFPVISAYVMLSVSIFLVSIQKNLFQSAGRPSVPGVQPLDKDFILFKISFWDT